MRARITFTETVDSLVKSHPLFGNVLARLPVEMSDETPAIMTDNKTIFLNPDWWNGQADAERRHVASFIALSMMTGSISRGKAIEDLDNWRWQMAVNLMLNRLLINEGIGILPKDAVFITSIDAEMTSEEVYAKLLTMSKEEIAKAVWPLYGNVSIVGYDDLPDTPQSHFNTAEE